MKELTILLLCLIAGFVYMNYIRKSLYLSLVQSKIDNREYLVRNLPDNQEAADQLSRLSQILLQLLDSLPEDENKHTKRLKERFNPKNITENIPGSMYVAYSVNKGDELSICIRHKETEKFLDMNTILFVAIHELSHIMTEETGHTKLFWENMKYLLEKAIEIGIYTPIDYSREPVKYCGMIINSSPLEI